jgi:hypothetical protein
LQQQQLFSQRPFVVELLVRQVRDLLKDELHPGYGEREGCREQLE